LADGQSSRNDVGNSERCREIPIIGAKKSTPLSWYRFCLAEIYRGMFMNKFRSLICAILALSVFLTFSGCHQAYSPGYCRQLPEGN